MRALLFVGLLLGSALPAGAQVPVDQPAKDEPKPSNDRLMDLLGGIGAPPVAPAQGADTPRPTPRVKEAVRACFDDARKRDVAVDGRVEIEVVLEGGKVKDATLLEALSYELLLRECLQAAPTGAEVPGATISTFTWLFIPSGG